MHTFVRRGGPNYQKGLEKVRALGKDIGIPLRKMFGGENNNPMFPVFPDVNDLQYNSNASTQLQLLGNFGCSQEPVNFISNEHVTSSNKLSKRNKEADEQKLKISLSNFFRDDVDKSSCIPNANVLSTGLRLSYDDEERNSSVTSASESMPTLPAILSLGHNLKSEIDSQRDELNRYIRSQENQMAKGIKEMRERHMTTFFSTVEEGVGKKLQEKELEIENINKRNWELVERIKQLAAETESWQYRAQYNESIVNILKDNLKQAMAQGVEQAKEGCGDSEVDDAVSSFDHNVTLAPGVLNAGTSRGFRREQMTCKTCRSRDVSVLFLPCHHLCLCTKCDCFVDLCPICRVVKTTSVHVFTS